MSKRKKKKPFAKVFLIFVLWEKVTTIRVKRRSIVLSTVEPVSEGGDKGKTKERNGRYECIARQPYSVIDYHSARFSAAAKTTGSGDVPRTGEWVQWEGASEMIEIRSKK